MPNKKVPKMFTDRIQSSINSLYSNAYYSSKDNKDTLDTIKDSIIGSMESILSASKNNYGMNISALYNKLQSDNTNTISSVSELFENKSLTDNILEVYNVNTAIKEHDEDIDLICKLMKKLDRALNIKKDLVLAADDFTKNTFSVSNKLSNTETNNKFSSNIDQLKKLYNLVENIETLYEDTAKYGDQFVYIAPFTKELAQLIYNNKKLATNTDQYNQPFYNVQKSSIGIIKESVGKDNLLLDEQSITFLNENNIPLNFNVSLVQNEKIMDWVLNEERTRIVSTKDTFDQSDLSFTDYRSSNDKSQEGLLTDKELEKIEKSISDIPGSIFKILDRSNTIPLYLDDTFLGVYYIEVKKEEDLMMRDRNSAFRMGGMSKNMTMKSSVARMENSSFGKENVLKNIASELSKVIDEKFIKANQNLKKEIYSILKYNDIFSDNSTSFRVHYIEPQYVSHWYFKKDKITNRGISDIEESIIPAILYSYMYITLSLAVLTRGYDKRVFYVKQMADSNISAVLTNAIDQLKRSNYGIKDVMGQMRGMFNILGRYNDHIFPVSQSGERPMDIEVIPGQDIRFPEELMSILEKLAIEPTGIGLEMIDMQNSVEFSRQVVVSNGNVARDTMKRQILVAPLIQDIINKLYRNQFDEIIDSNVTLPKPTTLSMMGLIEIINSAKQVAEMEFEMTCPQKYMDGPIGFIYKKKIYEKRIGTYVDWNDLEECLKEAIIEGSLEINNNDQNQGY